uniref:Uncharacterized protein n=1 Tax=Anguilla anguilla TaxID=7936 RepID=A0A0E9WQB4_ANGAN
MTGSLSTLLPGVLVESWQLMPHDKAACLPRLLTASAEIIKLRLYKATLTCFVPAIG